MITQTLSLPVLLPSDTIACERCIADLRDRLASVRGVQVVEIDVSQATLSVRLDPDQTTLARVEDAAKRAGVALARRFEHEMVELRGLDCADCVFVIEHVLGRLPGLLTVSVNYAASRMWIEYDRDLVRRAEIVRRVRAMGYEVNESERRRGGHRRELLIALLAGALLGGGWLAGIMGAPSGVSVSLFALSCVAGGWFPARGSVRSLRRRRVDVDILMIVAALGAAALGRWSEGAILLFLFSLGHALEHFAMDRARQAIRAIMQLAPREATVRRDHGDVTVAVDDVRPGETILIKPGDRLPLDGDVLGGTSSVDQAPITGESMPVFKEPGSKVFAGTINKDGALQIRVTRAVRETTLAKIAQLVQEAQAQKSPAHRFSERVARYLVPGVLGAVVLVLAVSPLFGLSLRDAFYRAMILLVAASPCALAIATPAAVLSAIGRAAMSGVLVKGGSALEGAGSVRAVALDKTGTLTRGEPAVTDVLPYDGATTDSVLRSAAAVERRSGHPLGRAIVRAAQDRGLPLSEAGDVRAVIGKGVTGLLDGVTVAVGSVELLRELGVVASALVHDALMGLQRTGKTSVIVAVDRQVVGIIGLADAPRPTAKSALDQLKRIGIHRLVMLTGDTARVAHAIAATLGVGEVRADLLPHEKVDAVKAIVARDGKVAMVGDGVNDAPALAAATVGIAIGAGGTDAALETADIALMADDLGKLSYAIGLGRATRAVTRQNLAISLGVIAVLVLTTVAGIVTLPAAVVLHEGSTLLVVANGLRLLAYTGPAVPAPRR